LAHVREEKCRFGTITALLDRDEPLKTALKNREESY
jgi:hypothetical protein